MTNTSAKTLPASFNKVVYAAMLFTGIIFITMGDWRNGAIFFPLALVFDPFDQSMTWGKRPVWQKAWLIVHLIIAFSILGIDILYK